MCEIVVLDPEQTPIQAAQQLAVRFNDEQGDGLGVLAVHNDGDAFDYNIFKSTAPHWQTLYTFFKRNYDAWRIVIHGRAMTSGKRNWDTCHPIEVECSKCEFDYVVHNGSVRKHTQKRGGLTTAGHHFNTEVDTEVIAHTVGELPESVDDHGYNTYPLKGNLNYLLFSEDGILVRSGTKYDLSESFTMTCSYRDFDSPGELGFSRGRNKRWALVTPSDDSPEVEIKESYRRNTTTSRNTNSNVTSSQDLNSEAQPGDWQDYSGEDSRANPNKYTETVKVTYDDHADFDNISAIKVAPGVMRVIDHDANEDEYVFQRDDPRLYFWYAPDPTPDNIGELQDEAQARGRSSEQESLEMLFEGEEEPNGAEGEAVYEEVATTVAGEIDDVTVADMADIKDDVIAAAFGGAKAAQNAHGD